MIVRTDRLNGRQIRLSTAQSRHATYLLNALACIAHVAMSESGDWLAGRTSVSYARSSVLSSPSTHRCHLLSSPYQISLPDSGTDDAAATTRRRRRRISAGNRAVSTTSCGSALSLRNNSHHHSARLAVIRPRRQ